MSKRFRSRRWLISAPAVGAMLFGAVWWQQAPVAAQSAAPAHPAHAPHWSYEGAEDPAHWAALSSARGAAGFAAARFDRADVRTVPVDIVNNGHTIQVDTVGSGVLVIGRDRYVLQQFHFHIPSEHTVDGRPYPLEAHFVQQDREGEARGRRPALRRRRGEPGARYVLESAAEIGRSAGRPGSGRRGHP
jgi:carbonic anhydrase